MCAYYVYCFRLTWALCFRALNFKNGATAIFFIAAEWCASLRASYSTSPKSRLTCWFCIERMRVCESASAKCVCLCVCGCVGVWGWVFVVCLCVCERSCARTLYYPYACLHVQKQNKKPKGHEKKLIVAQCINIFIRAHTFTTHVSFSHKLLFSPSCP